MSQDLTGDLVAHEVMLTVLDAEGARHRALPVSLADVVLAALAAEPETLAELETAITRYNRPACQTGFLANLREGISEERWDAGIVLIDLPARLVVADTEPVLYQPALSGAALYCPDPPPDWSQLSAEEAIWIYYQLSDDWLLADGLADWQTLAAQRRAERARQPRFDARPVLFGPALQEFILTECLAAHAAGQENPIVDIHTRWLLTPRPDLHGKTPRELLLVNRHFLDLDLWWREQQWSLTSECPLPLARESAAYRFAAFGTHSNVVHFDLLRHLLAACWEQVCATPNLERSSELARLAQLQTDWLATSDEYSFSPEWLLEQERLRVPLAASHQHAVPDPDCPICEMTADPLIGGPTFMHLDGHHLDLEDNWVFSFHATREDWEAERREWEERNRKFNEEWAAREAAGQPAFSPDNFAIDTWDFDAELEEKSLTDDDDDDQGKLVC